MDTTLTRVLAAATPDASAPTYPLFILSMVVVVLATLVLSPKVIDAVRRWKWQQDPSKDRRAPVDCDAHTTRIQALEAMLQEQKAQIEADRLMFLRELQSLRQFIEDKFRQDHEYAQTERLAQEQRITSLITSLINQVSR